MKRTTSYRRGLLKLGSCLVASYGVVCTAQAGEHDTLTPLLDMSLEQLADVKIVSSTLTPKTQKTAPASVTVFTRADIQKMGVNYLHELMNYVPGFQSFRQAEAPDEYYASVRGHRTGTSSREILIRIDGQRFNRETDNAVAVPMLALDNIAKIEFTRGPGSAIYGSNAYMGVVDITTAEGLNQGKLSAGNHQQVAGHVMASSQWQSLQMDAYTRVANDRGQTMQIEDAITHDEYSTDDPNAARDIVLKIHNENTQFSITDMKHIASDYYLIEQNGNGVVNNENEYSALNYTRKYSVSPVFDTSVSLRYRRNAYAATSYIAGFPVASNGEDKSAEFQLDANWYPDTAYCVQFGFERRQSENTPLYAKAEFGELLILEGQSRAISGLYLQGQYQLNSAADLTLGVRQDAYSDSGTALSPRAGFTYQLTQYQTIKLLYGEAFRAPTLNEVAVGNNSTLVGNPDLKPETVKTTEIAWLGEFGENLFTATLFNNRYENQIGQVESGTTRTFDNYTGQESSHGVELELMSNITRALQLRANLTQLYGVQESDFRQASKLASFVANYRWNKWNWNLGSHYAAERAMQVGRELNFLPAYWLVDAKLQHFHENGFISYLQIKNLMNEQYETPSQGVILQRGLENRGREVSVGFTVDF